MHQSLVLEASAFGPTPQPIMHGVQRIAVFFDPNKGILISRHDKLHPIDRHPMHYIVLTTALVSA
jgi:hypothetical protein